MPATYALKGKHKGGIRKPHSMALVVPGDDKGVNAILFDSVKQSNIGFKSLLSDDMNKSCQSYTLNRLKFGGPIEDIGDDGDDNLSVNAIDAAFANANANGWVIVTFVEEVQLLASVTVTVYAPATKPVAIAAVPPDGDHA